MGVPTETEVAAAIERVANVLAGMGHDVRQESPRYDGVATMRAMTDVWFFGFDLRLESYSKRTGQAIGAETLEPVIQHVYRHARDMKPVQFLNAMVAINSRTAFARPILRALRHLAVADHTERGRSRGAVTTSVEPT
jgi:hypothetical protein